MPAHLRLTVATALALLGALASPGASPAAVAPSPLDGNGMWIWMLSASGGSAEGVAEKATRHGVEVVFVKSGDGSSYWSQLSEELVAGLHAGGLRVCAWQFVYGGYPGAEARVGAAAVEAGADCLVIDAESHYEGRYSEAARYMRRLRELVGPEYPVALTSFPYVDYHPAFPYSVFLASGAAQYNVPQMYWRAIGTSVPQNFRHTYRFNRPYGAPIFPLGQTYQDPPRREVIAFRQLALAYGAAGVSWWSWQETDGPEWRWVGRPLPPQSAELRPARGYAVLSEGSGGDLVVWAQQLLRAAGWQVRVDGTYGPGTAAAVREFQANEGLEPTGTVGATTWRALLERPPVTTAWTARREARVLAGVRAASAASPVLGYELVPTPGRP